MKYRIEQIKSDVGIAEFEEFSLAWEFIKLIEECQLIRKQDRALLAIKTNVQIEEANKSRQIL